MAAVTGDADQTLKTAYFQRVAAKIREMERMSFDQLAGSLAEDYHCVSDDSETVEHPWLFDAASNTIPPVGASLSPTSTMKVFEPMQCSVNFGIEVSCDSHPA